ncbi:hypothetical protein G9A89_013502 [Geosiphon pyriformis]|nr:hypothetical protein G9A89_013502 [Geosiphon pyriformis]
MTDIPERRDVSRKLDEKQGPEFLRKGLRGSYQVPGEEGSVQDREQTLKLNKTFGATLRSFLGNDCLMTSVLSKIQQSHFHNNQPKFNFCAFETPDNVNFQPRYCCCPQLWSLVDFDTNIANSEIKTTNHAFYKYLNIILARDTSNCEEIKNAGQFQPHPKHWSLMNFDAWAFTNLPSSEPKIIHHAFLQVYEFCDLTRNINARTTQACMSCFDAMEDRFAPFVKWILTKGEQFAPFVKCVLAKGEQFAPFVKCVLAKGECLNMQSKLSKAYDLFDKATQHRETEDPQLSSQPVAAETLLSLRTLRVYRV